MSDLIQPHAPTLRTSFLWHPMIDLTIPPESQLTLVESVVVRIRSLIESRGLAPGDRLPGELELADQMSVSRSVVRESIGRLQMIGLLTVVRGRGGGTFVGDQNSVLSYARVVRSAMAVCPDDARQFAGFRAALEIYAARQAAEVANADDLAELDACCDQIGNAEHADSATGADYGFHRKLAEIAGNELILQTLKLSREFITSTMRSTGPRIPQESLMQHRAVVDAIRCRDPDAAEAAMRRHMDSVMEHLPPGKDA